MGPVCDPPAESPGKVRSMTDERKDPPRITWLPQATVFVSSFCIMVLELVAGRVVSRHLGSSLYTWTSVIGIVLAGIAVGNWLGGFLADRRRAAPTLSVLFLVSAATCVVVSFLGHTVGDWVFLWTLPWPLRVGLHVAIIFLVPSLVLGMISPVAAKMALDHSTETGRTIGSVYAWGVVGSLVGTFLTGFWLVAWLGTSAVVWSVGAVLAAMGVGYAVASRRAWAAAALFLLVAIPGAGPWSWAIGLGERIGLRESFGDDLIYVDESQYSHIRIHRISEHPDRRNMLLDKLLHSTIDMDHPEELHYGYERIYQAITHNLAGSRDSLHTLTIGGGGYVFPRYLDAAFPRSRTEVVEIDPAVTEAAIEAFGLPPDNDLEVVHADGRAFLRGRVEARRRGEGVAPYDLVYLDAVNDYSVPYQLTTLECVRQIHELLGPDGAFLMNMIDVYSAGRFLGAMVETMRRVFPHVSVLVEGTGVAANPDFRFTFILAATKRPVDWARIRAAYDPRIGLSRLTDAEIDDLLTRTGGKPLTDDWAPVENLLAPVVKSAWREIAAEAVTRRAIEALQKGDAERAIAKAQEALDLHPGNLDARHAIADAHLTRGEAARALPYYETVVEAHPRDLRARNSYAVALLRVGRRADAVRQLEEILRLDPANELAKSNLRKIRSAGGASSR
jgi:spermidine synthase